MGLGVHANMKSLVRDKTHTFFYPTFILENIAPTDTTEYRKNGNFITQGVKLISVSEHAACLLCGDLIVLVTGCLEA